MQTCDVCGEKKTNLHDYVLHSSVSMVPFPVIDGIEDICQDCVMGASFVHKGVWDKHREHIEIDAAQEVRQFIEEMVSSKRRRLKNSSALEIK